jgi:hypothetical protein
LPHAITRTGLRASLDPLATWTPRTRAAANRRLIAVMRRDVAAGEGLNQRGGGPRPPPPGHQAAR